MSYRILLIDHDPSGVERIQRPLAEAGYEVTVATAADGALDVVERLKPDLAVIEALLPEKPGAQLCQEIKDSPAGKNTPVVLVLEEDEEEQARARALDLHGCDLLIERSIEDEDLIGLCEQLLRTRSAQAEVAGEAVEPHDAEPSTEREDDQQEAQASDSPEEAAEDHEVTEQVAAQEAAEEQPMSESESNPVKEEDGAETMLDSVELASALLKLDSIIDEQTGAEATDSADQEQPSPEALQNEKKAHAAEKSGDFSYLAEENVEPVSVDESAASPADAAEPALVESYSRDGLESGQDIDDHLDSLFAQTAPGEPSPAEKQVLSWTFNNGPGQEEAEPARESMVAPVTPATEPEREEPAALSAAPPTEPVTPPTSAAPPLAEPPVVSGDHADIDFDNVIGWDEPNEQQKPVAPAREAAAATTSAVATPVQTASFARVQAESDQDASRIASERNKWLLLAACSLVLIVGAAAMLVIRGIPGSQPSTAGTEIDASSSTADTTPLVATVIGAPEPGETNGTQLVAPAEQSAPTTSEAEATPVPPSEQTSTTTVKDETPAAKPPVTTPPTTTAGRSRPAAAKPEPRMETTAPAKTGAAAVAVVAAPKPSSKPAPVVAKPEPTPVARNPKPAPVKEPSMTAPPKTQSAAATTAAEPLVAQKPQAPAAGNATNAVPAEDPNRQTAPENETTVAVASAPRPEPAPVAAAPDPTSVEVLQRIEPSYPPKALKKARGGRIVLKLLVNEEGRVARVLVEEGSPQKDLEAAAVGAVLRWKFTPATEAGSPVKAWTTAEFDL